MQVYIASDRQTSKTSNLLVDRKSSDSISQIGSDLAHTSKVLLEFRNHRRRLVEEANEELRLNPMDRIGNAANEPESVDQIT